MAKECELVDFYRRFQTLQIQRETSDGLIKVGPPHADSCELETD